MASATTKMALDSEERMELLWDRFYFLGTSLEKLKELHVNDLIRNDQRVHTIEQEIYMKLNILPNMWIPNDMNMENLIEKISKHRDNLGKILDTETPNIVSQPPNLELILQGILHTGRVKDILKKRACLLKPKGEFNVKHNQFCCDTDNSTIKQFVSQKEETMYKNLTLLGLKGFFPDMYTTHSLQSSTTAEYLSTVNITHACSASIAFNVEELTLSDDAYIDLHKIDQALGQGVHKQEVMKMCQEFFTKYGSHVNMGPIKLGGLFWRKCCTTKFETGELEKLQSLHNEVVTDDSLNSSMSFESCKEISLSKVKSLSEVNCSQSAFESTRVEANAVQLFFETIGLLEWKEALRIHMQTWNVIDRGCHFIPVWDLVLKYEKHHKLLKNTNRLVLALKTSFGQLSENRTYLEKLGLQQYYPQQLTLKEAITIKKDTPQAKQVALAILQMVMSFDCNCVKSNQVTLGISDDDDCGEDHDGQQDIKQGTNVLHSVETIFGLFICADNFLQQDMMVRLSSCQLAIPFVLKDPLSSELIFPIWAMKAITKLSDDETIQMKEWPMVDYKMPIISFLRLGNRKHLSKSKVLNYTLSHKDNIIEYFFSCDHETTGHTISRFSNGLVDMVWYIPELKGGIFPTPIAFLNLHGNAAEEVNQSQVEFLAKISSMCVILLAVDDFEEASVLLLTKKFSTMPGYLLLLEKNQSSIEQQLKGRVKMGIEYIESNYCSVQNLLQGKISSCCKVLDKKSISSKTLEARECGIRIDEDYKENKMAIMFANGVIKKIRKYDDIEELKKNLLPLQGEEMWQKWAFLDKEEHRQEHRGEKCIQNYTEEIKNEKRSLRNKQLDYLKMLDPIMSLFIEYSKASFEKGWNYVLAFFLQYLRLGLNRFAFDLQDASCKLRKQAKEVNEKFLKANFGLENLFRELSQIYECSYSCESTSQQFPWLPLFGASLLANGFPLEIMDGNTTHVPIQWVEAVVSEAAKLLNNPKVFILSVLGLQSSGKSTLLNTMFGIQCTRRCTHGAFMQLLPISSELREEIKCDYVLVVDTEGLGVHAQFSSSSSKWDNQLAAFVLGLADKTLINLDLLGKTAMDDILEIVIYAFIRMQEIDPKPKCQFVHQNGNDESNYQLRDIEKNAFIAKLNEVTLLAAKGQSRHQKFCHLFDLEHDIKCIGNIWRGSPPMASVDPSYSKEARELRNSVMAEIKNSKTLSSISHRVTKLWNAILHESFVFSFKNSLELEEYRALESHCSQLKWSLLDEIAEWEQDTGKNIDTSGDIDLDEQSQSLYKITSDFQQSVTEDLESYCSQSTNKQIILSWMDDFKNRLIDQSDNYRSEALNRCSQHCIGRQLVVKLHDERLCRYKEQIATAVCDYTGQMSSNLNEAEIKYHFDEWWKKSTKDIERHYISEPNAQVMKDIERELLQFLGSGDQQLLLDLKKGNDKFETSLNLILKSGYIIVKSHQSRAMLGTPITQCQNNLKVSKEELHLVQSIVNDEILQRVDEYLGRIKDLPYSPNYIAELLRKVNHVIDQLEDTVSRRLNKSLVFTNGCRVYVYLMTSYYAGSTFKVILTEFHKKNDPFLFIEMNMKEHFYAHFKDEYKRAYIETKFARPFCKELFCRTKTKIEKCLHLLIIEKIKEKLQHKQILKTKILIDFGNERNFENYIIYLENPAKYMEKWIKKYIREYCEQVVADDTEPQTIILQRLATQELSEISSFLLKKVNASFNAFVSVEEVSTKEWLMNFCDDQIKSKIGEISLGTLESIEASVHFTRFTQIVLLELSKSKEKLETEFKKLKYDDLEWTEIENTFVIEMIGCREQCPFCKEICDLGTCHAPRGIKHSVSHHHPTSLGGFKKNELPWRERCKDQRRHFRQFPGWSIPVDQSSDTSFYWKWFTATYQKEIQQHFEFEPMVIPSEWNDLKWPEVKANLERCI